VLHCCWQHCNNDSPRAVNDAQRINSLLLLHLPLLRPTLPPLQLLLSGVLLQCQAAATADIAPALGFC
jgi:hypothetical protein